MQFDVGLPGGRVFHCANTAAHVIALFIGGAGAQPKPFDAGDTNKYIFILCDGASYQFQNPQDTASDAMCSVCSHRPQKVGRFNTG